MVGETSDETEVQAPVVGETSDETEVQAPAAKVWEEIYGGLQLRKFVLKQFSDLIQKIDILEGDGGVGTVLHLTFAPGFVGPVTQKEKFIKMDNEKRIKQVEIVEGGYLDFGFSLYKIRIEVIEKGENSCIVKSTIEYELKEDAPANALSFVNIGPMKNLAQLVNNYFLNTQEGQGDA